MTENEGAYCVTADEEALLQEAGADCCTPQSPRADPGCCAPRPGAVWAAQWGQSPEGVSVCAVTFTSAPVK